MKSTTTLRRIATAVAAFGVLTMSSGAVLMVTAGTANADPISQPNSNHEDYWETLPGEVCIKTDTGAESGNVILPAEPAGRDYSKLIIKKSSGDDENQVFDDPVAGEPGYEWVRPSKPQQNGGWSHFIVCTVPEPVVEEPEEIAVDIVFTDPTCENENQASYAVTGDTDHVTVESSTPAAPGASVTVTATAKPGFEFAGGEDEYSESYEFDEAETPCDVVEPPVVVTPPAPEFVDPTCDDPTADVVYQDVAGVEYSVVGEIAPGALVEVQANPADGYVFPEGFDNTWEHTFGELPTDCNVVDTPDPETPDTPDEDTPDTTVATPTVVHAGLTDAGDLRGEQGLALLLAGMIITLGAGTVAVRTSRG